MSEEKPKPTQTQMILWAIPAVAGILFTIVALVLHKGVEWGLGGTLFGFLYFLLRYGAYGVETPDQ
ncbi:hypothetical protein [Ponticaulis sp.]|uniref:hypothetical protein n=1 Tax=Ponticaulis sp. TaxID=2020902 RepID=UPI000B747AB9|nr:hypothetical protein [Ponticaulis sp.]OUX97793.1 MAG: hypothetical protein CBB65_13420 [Hyphomonadaceae bacterium TMED5]|tara:strand:- start:56256 stop:56453 length:198 start_codon:yes stop_codon:yes gene_type:complete